MREMTKSIISYSFEAPLLALQQLVGSLKMGESKEAGEDGARENGDPKKLEGMFEAAFMAADDLQRDLVDMSFDLLGPQSWTMSGLARTTADFTSRMADGLNYLDPSPSGMAAWRELRNKIDIYMLVKAVQEKLKIPQAMFSLPEYVDKAYDLGAFPALWAVEGLGHDYADRFRPYGNETAGILTDDKVKDIPDKSLTMLHAGIGLGFAQDLLKTVNESSTDAELHDMLDLYIDLCQRNSRPGYEGAALESLGLVTRTWHRKMVPAIDRRLMQKDETVAAYFWRGAGRAIYFLPVNFLPAYGCIFNAIRISRREAPHDLARQNMLSGIAWASTVVNMLQPSVMEAFLSQHGEDITGQPAWENGVASSIIMRQDTTPDEGFIREYVYNRPSDARVNELWRLNVQKPGQEALDSIYPVLREKKRLGEVFRFQSLSDLVAHIG